LFRFRARRCLAGRNRQPARILYGARPLSGLQIPRVITGTGSYLPERRVTNEELLDIVEGFDPERAGSSLDDWIQQTFGIRSRHWAADDESTGDMATIAAERALENAGLEVRDIDLIVMSTATSDHVAPHSVSVVQSKLGSTAPCHQIQAACSGFVDAVIVADSLMARLGYRRALVISGEKMTHLVDKSDFRMIGLFADAAGALVLEEAPVDERYGFKSFYAGFDGSKGGALRVPAGGTRRPLTPERLERGEQYLISDFSAVWEFATATTGRCIQEAAERAEIPVAEVDWVVPHHASRNILEEGARRIGVDWAKLVLSMEHTGNTSSASVPTALDEAARAGRFQDGDAIVLCALGGGLAWSSALYRWCDPKTAKATRQA